MYVCNIQELQFGLLQSQLMFSGWAKVQICFLSLLEASLLPVVRYLLFSKQLEPPGLWEPWRYQTRLDTTGALDLTLQAQTLFSAASSQPSQEEVMVDVQTSLGWQLHLVKVLPFPS